MSANGVTLDIKKIDSCTQSMLSGRLFTSNSNTFEIVEFINNEVTAVLKGYR